LVVIEDTAETQLTAPNLVRFEARKEQASDNPDHHVPAITIRDLLKASLRHRPDRIILGEIRGGEAFDLLQALNTGHSGSLSTIHANSAVQSVSRFSNCVLQSGIEIPHRAIQAQIADALDFLLYIERRHGRRYVAELAELRGYNSQTDTYDKYIGNPSLFMRTIAAQYLRQLFQSDDKIALTLIKKRTSEPLQRIAFAFDIATDRWQNWLRSKNSEGFEIYCTMTTLMPTARNRDKSDIQDIRRLP
jgi:hypothetical protein